MKSARTNQSALCKQGWALFIYWRCFLRVTFRKTASRGEHAKHIQNKHIQKNHTHFLAQESYTSRSSDGRRLNYIRRIYRNCWYKVITNKTRVEVYREVLTEVENFIKQQTEEIFERKEIFVEEVFYFYIFLMILVF